MTINYTYHAYKLRIRKMIHVDEVKNVHRTMMTIMHNYAITYLTLLTWNLLNFSIVLYVLQLWTGYPHHGSPQD